MKEKQAIKHEKRAACMELLNKQVLGNRSSFYLICKHNT